MGPSALRYAGLDNHLRQIGCRVRDCGNVEIPVRDELPSEGGLAYLPAVVKACRAVYEVGLRAIAEGEVPIFLGGDHSIALGTVAAATEAGPSGVLWIDAHGDFNTPETSPTGNLHGMPLAALTGLGSSHLIDIARPGPKVPARDVVLVGLRSLDSGERDLLRASGVTVFTMREIDELGIGQVVQAGHREARSPAEDPRQPRHGQPRPERGARGWDAGSGGPDLSRGPSPPRVGGCKRQGRLHRCRRDQPDSRQPEPDGEDRRRARRLPAGSVHLLSPFVELATWRAALAPSRGGLSRTP